MVPEGFAGEWLGARPESVALVRDVPELPAARLDELAGVVTGCAVTIAETGTIVLDHGAGQGRVRSPSSRTSIWSSSARIR